VANAFTQKPRCRRWRVSVEFVIGMSRGSARFRPTGGCTPGVKGKRGRAHRQTGGTGKMWPACEISVPRCIVDINQEDAGGGQRWRCPSATRLHIGELSAGPGPRDRCDAAIPRRRQSPVSYELSRLAGGRGGGHGLEGRGRVGSSEQRTTRGGGKDGRGRWCEDRTIVCLLTAISSQ